MSAEPVREFVRSGGPRRGACAPPARALRPSFDGALGTGARWNGNTLPILMELAGGVRLIG